MLKSFINYYKNYALGEKGYKSCQKPRWYKSVPFEKIAPQWQSVLYFHYNVVNSEIVYCLDLSDWQLKGFLSISHCSEKANLAVTLSTATNEVLAHASFSDHPIEELVDQTCWKKLLQNHVNGETFTVGKANKARCPLIFNIPFTAFCLPSSPWTRSSCVYFWLSLASP